jgi:hypothetical protein
VQFYVYLLYMWNQFSHKVMADVIAEGGGLFTARTVDEWYFIYLYLYLSASAASDATINPFTLGS